MPLYTFIHLYFCPDFSVDRKRGPDEATAPGNTDWGKQMS